MQYLPVSPNSVAFSFALGSWLSRDIDNREQRFLARWRGCRAIDAAFPFHVDSVHRLLIDPLTPRDCDAICSAAEAVLAVSPTWIAVPGHLLLGQASLSRQRATMARPTRGGSRVEPTPCRSGSHSRINTGATPSR